MRVARASVPASRAISSARLKAFVDECEKIVFDRGVEDLAIREIAEDPHQRAGRQLFVVGFGHD